MECYTLRLHLHHDAASLGEVHGALEDWCSKEQGKDKDNSTSSETTRVLKGTCCRGFFSTLPSNMVVQLVGLTLPGKACSEHRHTADMLLQHMTL